MVPEALLAEAARRFALLGDRTRLALLGALGEGGELSVSALADATGLALANVSQHLSRLAEAGLVARRREGTSVLYRIADPTVDELCELVCRSLAETSGRAARAGVARSAARPGPSRASR